MSTSSIQGIFSDIVNKTIDLMVKYGLLGWDYISHHADITALFFAVGAVFLYIMMRFAKWGS